MVTLPPEADSLFSSDASVLSPLLSAPDAASEAASDAAVVSVEDEPEHPTVLTAIVAARTKAFQTIF